MVDVSVILPTYNRAHLLPRAIESVLRQTYRDFELIKRSGEEIGVVYSTYRRCYGESSVLIPSKEVRHRDGAIATELMRHSFVGQPAVLMRRSCFDRVGLFDETLLGLHDWDLFLRLSHYYRFRHIDEVLLDAHVQESSISSDLDGIIRSYEMILRKHRRAYLNAGEGLLSRQYGSLASLCCLQGKMAEGRTYFCRSLAISPFQIKTIAGFIASLLGRSWYHRTITKYWVHVKKKDFSDATRQGDRASCREHLSRSC